MRTISIAVSVALSASLLHAQQADWSAVENAFGRKGVPQAGDVMRFNLPRTDLTVTARGVTLKPAFALGSWTAFKRVSGGVMVMGDLVLLDTEVSPVMAKLQAGGVTPTALHNHVLGEQPRVMYMHISAHGDEVKIAQAIRSALAVSATPMASPPAAGTPAAMELDTAAVAKALGYPGRVNGGVFQFGVARAEKVTEGGMEVPASMGLSTAINFQPTGGGKAAITGDFVMVASEVPNVQRALRENGIEITALHSHMLDESPRLLFMHFWANDDAVKLARGLSAALGVMNVTKPTH